MATTLPNSDLGRYSREITRLNVKPLWERTTGMKPGTPAAPTLWRYADLRPELMRAAALIATQDAERRVLMLENPGLPGSGYITSSLYCGLQIILPGEVAPAHRHTTNALRFVIEGEGAYTSVDGERVSMHPGDFVVTPGWSWHDHGHAGSGPVIWLDALDNPFGQFFGATFRENYPEETYPLRRAEGDAASRYGAGLLPLDHPVDQRASPLLVYPYERTRDALYRLSPGGPVHPVHGAKRRHAHPADGRHPFPTIAVFMQWLPRGLAGEAYRATAGTVFNVAEGPGRVVIEDETFTFPPHDVFVVPPWCRYRLDAGGDCGLFSYSDRPAQEALGFWRGETLG